MRSIRVTLFLLMSAILCACSAPTTQSGAMLQSDKIGEALDNMKRLAATYDAAIKYRYVLTQDLQIVGRHVGAVAWVGRGVVEMDYDFVNRADIKTLTSTMLHEVCHIELRHFNYSAQNEGAAIECQIAFMAQLYN